MLGASDLIELAEFETERASRARISPEDHVTRMTQSIGLAQAHALIAIAQSTRAIAEVLAARWARQSAEQKQEHPGECQCWNCQEWRPDSDESCPHCGADAVPF